jgi:hypothetical protein
MSGRERGSIPEPDLQDREPDRDVLSGGEHGPFSRGERIPRFTFDQMHPSLQEILIRMDREEIALFNRGVKLLTSLEEKDLDRFKLSLKVFGAVLLLWRGIKWSVGAFLAGLAAVSLAGEQIQKLAGSVLKLIKYFTGGG